MRARKPPNDLQRWVANHPWLWILIFAGGGFSIAMSSIPTDMTMLVIAIIFIGMCATAGAVGAAAARISVKRYDATSRS